MVEQVTKGSYQRYTRFFNSVQMFNTFHEVWRTGRHIISRCGGTSAPYAGMKADLERFWEEHYSSNLTSCAKTLNRADCIVWTHRSLTNLDAGVDLPDLSGTKEQLRGASHPTLRKLPLTGLIDRSHFSCQASAVIRGLWWLMFCAWRVTILAPFRQSL